MSYTIMPSAGTHDYQPAREITITTTGNINDLDFDGAALIRFDNATWSQIQGLKAGYAGQIVTIRSIGAGEVYFAHQNAGSSAINRLINNVTSGITPLKPGLGQASYQYDATTQRWKLINHVQGGAISIPFNIGNFSVSAGSTLVMAAGDQVTFDYTVQDNRIIMEVSLQTMSITVAPSAAFYVLIPNGYTAFSTAFYPYQSIDTAATTQISVVQSTAGGTLITCFYTVAALAWPISANTTYVRFVISVGIQ